MRLKCEVLGSVALKPPGNDDDSSCYDSCRIGLLLMGVLCLDSLNSMLPSSAIVGGASKRIIVVIALYKVFITCAFQ